MIFSAVYYQVSWEGYQIICVLGPFHLQRVSKLYRKYKPVRITQRKEHQLIWNSETTQILNIYLHNYQTETAFLLATKHEKKNYGMQLLKFFQTENTSKQQKMVAFMRNCLVKMTLRLLSHFLLLWIWFQCFWGSSEAKISTGYCWSYANLLNS